ncbi:MAG TPA: hypothetical protein VLW45_05855 [Pelomicrobium sp.]|nr:hypothetical protein [Pelomicrobium sp.]
MRRLELDFRARPPLWPVVALLAVAAFVLFDAGWRYAELRRELARLERPEADPAGGPRMAAAGPEAGAGVRAARNVIADLTLPWNTLFAGLERSLTEDRDAALLALQPDTQKGLVNITGEARDYPSVLAFMVRLEAGRTVDGVHLLSHEVRQDDPQRPYVFRLAAQWREAR